MSTSLRDLFNSSPDAAGDWVVRIHTESEWGDCMMEPWAETGALPFFGPMSECPSSVLDKEFDTGYGVPQRPIYNVWTTDYVGVPTEYDGSTWIAWHPRNPAPYEKGER